jgi:hypothetical protein
VTAFGAGDDGSFTLRSNYWCAFLSACLRVLADHGCLAFELPAVWDYALYASDVRHAIHQQFQSVEVHRSCEPLFPEVREGCVVLVAKGCRNDPTISVRINQSNAHALITALLQSDGEPTNHHAPDRTGDLALTSFSDLYAVKIGCVTGDAKYFLLRESDRGSLVRTSLGRISWTWKQGGNIQQPCCNQRRANLTLKRGNLLKALVGPPGFEPGTDGL